MSCRSCGAEVVPGARFCFNCGASQASVGEERRVVTALFADIVGFTGLAEQRDPEEVKHLVDRAFGMLTRNITEFGGVVDKIVGDQIVALFGAPVAHSDDAERAVRAGLRMLATVGSLDAGDEVTSDRGRQHDRENDREREPEEPRSPRPGAAVDLRIGINTGEVLVGSTSAGGDYTAMGDVMNSAARLQDLAGPGEVLVGAATRAATGDSIRYRPMGELAARGRRQPIDAWVAVEAMGLPGDHHRKAARFIGRERELAFLEAQAALAFEVGTAQLAVVVGEVGMGKTRLVDEVSARLESSWDPLIVEGRSVAYGEANVWWPIGEIIRRVLGLEGNDGPAATAAAVDEALVSRFGESHSELSRWSTALSHVLGLETSLRGGDKARNRAEVSMAVVNVLEYELRFRPMVLQLTDIHWAADAVWGLLNEILGELARCALFVILSAQTLDRDNVVAGRHGASVLRLGPLNPAQARQLLSEVGGDRLDDAADELVARSGGNPFFLEELAGLLLADGPDGDRPRGAGTGHDLDQLPGNLRGIVAARLDSLDPAQRGLIEDASVLGRTGSVPALLTLATEGRGAVDPGFTLDRLVEADLLAIERDRYEFRSDLVREVAYGTLTKTVRVQRHLGIAEYLENATRTGRIRNSVLVAIAEHYRAAAQLLDDLTIVPGLDRVQIIGRALHWLEQAAVRALEVGEPNRAVQWYDHGVEQANRSGADRETTARLLFGRARARCEVHDVAGARADLDRLDPMLAHDPALAARALMVRGDVDRKAGDLDQAAGRLREAADRLSALGEHVDQALALRLLGITEIDRSDDALARQALVSSRAVAARAGDRRSEAWALQSLAWHAFIRGEVRTADDLAHQAVEIFAELNDRGGLAWTRGVQAWVAFHLGRREQAQALVASVLPDSRRRGDPWSEGMMLHLSAALALWGGRARQAQDLARRSQELARGAKALSLEVQSMALEARALVSLGRVGEGTALLERTYAVAERHGDRNAKRIAVISNCASAARLGESLRAIQWATRYDGERGDPTDVGESDLTVSLALALLQRNSVVEAAGQLDWSTESELDEVGGFALAVGALVAAAQGRLDDAERLAHETIDGTSATYLDRFLAAGARAAARYRRGDSAGCDRALALASEQLEPTDDVPSRLILGMLNALCGRVEVDRARLGFTNAGLDPSGWWTVWALATGADSDDLTSSSGKNTS